MIEKLLKERGHSNPEKGVVNVKLNTPKPITKMEGLMDWLNDPEFREAASQAWDPNDLAEAKKFMFEDIDQDYPDEMDRLNKDWAQYERAFHNMYRAMRSGSPKSAAGELTRAAIQVNGWFSLSASSVSGFEDPFMDFIGSFNINPHLKINQWAKKHGLDPDNVWRQLNDYLF